jgi:hypothetical protein
VTAGRISASQIGSMFGATGREINRLLKEQGFLFGEPGAYGLTPKGQEFGRSESHHRGSDGPSPIYRRDWETVDFNPEIVDALDVSPSAVARVRSDIRAEDAARRATQEVAQADADRVFRASPAGQKAIRDGILEDLPASTEVKPAPKTRFASLRFMSTQELGVIALNAAAPVVADALSNGAIRGIDWAGHRYRSKKAVQSNSPSAELDS